MSTNQPGFQRPNIDPSVHDTVKRAFRNVYDNLSNLKSKTDENSAAISKTAEKFAEKSGEKSPESGVYTPVLFNSTNLDASTPYPAQWMRVGNVVTVSGRVDVDPTAAAPTKLGISLPVKTNFQFGYQLGGTAACPTIAGEVSPIAADTGNNRADMSWVTTNTTNHVMSFSFTYLVN